MISDVQRHRFLEIAATILPGGHGLPPASAVDIAGRLLDRTLAARPDLAGPLAACLERATGTPPSTERAGPGDADLILVVATASYLLAPEVREALGYPGQEALEPPRGGCGVEELALDLMEAGPRWRDPEAGR